MYRIITRVIIGFAFSVLLPMLAYGQTDSLINLDEVVIRGYISQQPKIKSPTSVGLLSLDQMDLTSQQSLVQSFNQIPGLRMEERSPGSYRLSIRGSLLRSPFGVRNVKVYMNEFPLTDAGGNTYVNSVDPKTIERVEILKGPDGSLFGANSGGVVLLNTLGNQDQGYTLKGELSGGSFGGLHENTTFKQGWDKSELTFNQAYQRSDGYRKNSALSRLYLQASHKWKYGDKSTLTLFGFHSDLHYETPGGLTETQFATDPQQARQPAGPNPGAEEQKAGIYNQLTYAGISNEIFVIDNLRYVTTLFGSYTDFRNPFITNYEVRYEKNIGARSYFEWVGGNNTINWVWDTGLEVQGGDQDISNYQNNGGERGSFMASDQFRVGQQVYFTQFSSHIGEQLTGEVGISYNTYSFTFTGNANEGKKKFKGEWMPRLGISYLVSPDISIRASLSRGYSPPTISEIRPSNTIVNENLRAESGWNYELGFRLIPWNGRLQWDASVYRYNLENAIVRRIDTNDAEYFVNAGGTHQVGIESALVAQVVQSKSSGIFRGLKIMENITLNDFHFDDYESGGNDYSENSLTGVPPYVFNTGLMLDLPASLQLNVSSNVTGKIPLNDGNSVYAEAYHLVQAKITWSHPIKARGELKIFIGGDNLLNEKYSLGNDINAFGGRYFNAAPTVNFYGGANISF